MSSWYQNYRRIKIQTRTQQKSENGSRMGGKSWKCRVANVFINILYIFLLVLQFGVAESIDSRFIGMANFFPHSLPNCIMKSFWALGLTAHKDGKNGHIFFFRILSVFHASRRSPRVLSMGVCVPIEQLNFDFVFYNMFLIPY